MTLNYELTSEDLEAFFQHHARHAPYITKRNTRMRWLWAACLALLSVGFVERSPARAAGILALAAVFAALYPSLNTWWYVRHNRKLNAGPDAPVLGAVTLLLDGEHLVAEAPEGSSTLELSAVRRIEESSEYFYIYTSPIAALIVPKRYAEAAAFVASLQASRAAA